MWRCPLSSSQHLPDKHLLAVCCAYESREDLPTTSKAAQMNGQMEMHTGTERDVTPENGFSTDGQRLFAKPGCLCLQLDVVETIRLRLRVAWFRLPPVQTTCSKVCGQPFLAAASAWLRTAQARNSMHSTTTRNNNFGNTNSQQRNKALPHLKQ